jgi:hypothetical protein
MSVAKKDFENLADNRMAGHLINKIRKELDLPPVKPAVMSQKAKAEAQKNL